MWASLIAIEVFFEFNLDGTLEDPDSEIYTQWHSGPTFWYRVTEMSWKAVIGEAAELWFGPWDFKVLIKAAWTLQGRIFHEPIRVALVCIPNGGYYTVAGPDSWAPPASELSRKLSIQISFSCSIRSAWKANRIYGPQNDWTKYDLPILWWQCDPLSDSIEMIILARAEKISKKNKVPCALVSKTVKEEYFQIEECIN